jgi:hypothetical protein
MSCEKGANRNKNEDMAIEKILNFYDGKCMKSKGLLYDNGNKKKYFEIEISDSELLNNEFKDLKYHSANIAYLFYSNLDVEKDNYQEIKVKIVLNNGTSEEFSYLSLNLLEIENLQPFINPIIDGVRRKKYENLLKSFDESISIETKNLEDLFSSLENKYGKINMIQFQGFQFRKTNNYGDVIVIKEAVIFGKTALSMNLIFKRENSKLIAIEFE